MPPKKRKSTVADTSANEQPSKRARKPVAETAATTRSKPKTAPAKGADTPRKRGRSPKNRDSTTGASAKSTVAKTQEKPKRPRGRPPKKQQSAQAQPSSTSGTRGENEQLSSKPEEEQKNVEEHEDNADEQNDGRSYWLMKAEPESRIVKGVDVKFSIDDLRAAEGPEPWDGVRNLVARNNLRAMKKGDYAFFYHSNCKQPGIVGIMEIVREHSVDESAFDPAHPYYDEKSSRDNPKWEVVYVEFRRKFQNMVSLETLKSGD
ncbi:AT DNA binding protein [Rasamsonia emersonii CBS 393.64]|uniref:Thymocyte nuclear protein 1 n=1 Tax=Rasamsonia emersonii (strain ATCC 16479 / CBS 393.64 / IMI 116815) TaxID=1408163 RepID=A0A0F4Z687_RASE3|nr:AT DNA binding protein [Rasamsonia emersonii CBS 393.64]KKA25835.1 AT DNA binding protein [Rasamsonia emersonii CBS 393.64]